MAYSIGLQLYSVRTEFETDYKATLRKVKELGFDGVEFAGFYDIPSAEMRETLENIGLRVAGSHTSYELLKDNLDWVIDYNRSIGNKNIICPMCTFSNKEELEEIVKSFKYIGGRLREEGFHFAYHNHSHEFEKIEDEYILDLIFSMCDEVKPELDVYWVYQGREDEKAYLRKYLDSMELVHIKDGTREGGCTLLEGDVDIVGVLDIIENSKITWIVVEDETPYPESFASVERSITNLKRHLANI